MFAMNLSLTSTEMTKLLFLMKFAVQSLKYSADIVRPSLINNRAASLASEPIRTENSRLPRPPFLYSFSYFPSTHISNNLKSSSQECELGNYLHCLNVIRETSVQYVGTKTILLNIIVAALCSIFVY